MDLNYSFYEDDEDLLQKAKECAGIIFDIDANNRDPEQLKVLFLDNNISVHDRIIALAHKIVTGDK